MTTTIIDNVIVFLIIIFIASILLYVFASIVYAISPWFAIAFMLYIMVITWFYLKYKSKIDKIIKKLIE